MDYRSNLLGAGMGLAEHDEKAAYMGRTATQVQAPQSLLSQAITALAMTADQVSNANRMLDELCSRVFGPQPTTAPPAGGQHASNGTEAAKLDEVTAALAARLMRLQELVGAVQRIA